MSDSVDTTVDTTSSRERIKRALSHGKKGRINKDLSNKIMLGVFRAAAYITTLVLVAIIAYVVINGLPHISLDFIFGWPQGVNAEGGIWPTIVSTGYVTALANRCAGSRLSGRVRQAGQGRRAHSLRC